MLVVATLLSAALFVFDEAYLPRRQPPPGGSPLRHQGQARADLPPTRPQVDVRQTAGQAGGGAYGKDGEPTRIFYYQFFDPDRNLFANITVFELNPNDFTLSRRIFVAVSAVGRARRRMDLRERVDAHLHRRRDLQLSAVHAVDPSRRFESSRATSRKKPGSRREMSYTELAAYIEGPSPERL